ncbi:D-glycero-beta-D-manno-heptose 1,7-bisphosphate 7-phosphatase [Candidatus Aenigmatarchaeota archaeon]
MNKAVFLDRDGVINEDRGFINTIDDIILYENSGKAIKMLNDSGFLVIIITNQPVIARGEITEKGLNEIHEKMKNMLAKDGAKIDKIYYCPHHPDKGFPGERPEYKIECNCRKPKTGMVEQAVKDFDIDVASSFFVGDKTTDIKAGKDAGCKTILVKTGIGGKDNVFDITPDYVCNDILDAVKTVVSK